MAFVEKAPVKDDVKVGLVPEKPKTGKEDHQHEQAPKDQEDQSESD